MTLLTILLLVAVATAVAIVSRLIKAPYTVALVLAGLAIGSLGSLSVPHLTKGLLFGLFLPGLLFEAALHIALDELKQNARTVLTLAIPGVLVSILVIGGSLALGRKDLGLPAAMVFAALIGATDPIAVVALFKQLHAPRRLGLIVEAESLLNDGTAVVFFTIVMGWYTGKDTTVGGAMLSFVRITGGGVIVGVVAAFALRLLMRIAREPMVGVSLTTLAAYGSFEIAERLHFSGVIATVVAGMIVGDAARHGRQIGTATRVSIEAFWEYIAFALNSIVFLMIGFEVKLGELYTSLGLIAFAYAVVAASRALLVGSVVLMFRRTPERMDLKWALVVGWGGLRGALSMVLALSVPADFPHRRELVAMTYGVVLASLVLQGLTIRPILRRLGLVEADA